MVTFISGCGDKKPSSAAKGAQNTNIRSFPAPYAKVWKETLETVEFEYLLGIEVQDKKKGFFSSEMIRDYQPFQKKRFRLSGTLTFDGKETIVKLYRHEEILVENEWKAVPSNSSMESQILTSIAKKLQ